LGAKCLKLKTTHAFFLPAAYKESHVYLPILQIQDYQPDFNEIWHQQSTPQVVT
jgi:hypothetical protein